ncbi:MAG: hypothetical protein ABI583_07675 [Betaproteobacteria bacterium]
MKSKSTLYRTNPQAVRHTLLTALVFCAIVVHAQNATADVSHAPLVVGNRALASYADSNGTTRTSTSSALQADATQAKSYTPTQTDVKPTSPNQQVKGDVTTIDSQTGSATYRIGSQTGRSYSSVKTLIRGS